MCNILVLITLKVFQRAGWRWVHGLVIPIFLIWRKNNILISRYLDFCAFVKSTDFKMCDVIIGIASSGVSTYAYFFWILSTLKKKFGQILVCCKTNISNMFLALDWKLAPGFIMILLKWQYSEIWQFLIVNIYNF